MCAGLGLQRPTDHVAEPREFPSVRLCGPLRNVRRSCFVRIARVMDIMFGIGFLGSRTPVWPKCNSGTQKALDMLAGV